MSHQQQFLKHIEQVLTPALEQLTSGTALSNDHRLRAEKVCDGFKKSGDGVLNSLGFLNLFLQAKRSGRTPKFMESLPLHHFFLQVVLFGIENRWNGANAFTQAQKVNIKSRSLSLLMAYCAVGPPAYITQKAADILAELCKRDWPQQWQAFHTELLQRAKSGNMHAIRLALMTLTSLSEDSTSPFFHMLLPSARRQQIRQGLLTIQSALRGFLMHVAAFAAPKLNQLKQRRSLLH